jgi:hypothetical protein
MSIANDKKNIINEISVLNSLGKTVSLPDKNFTYQSINTNNEPIPFMLDLLTATVGSEVLKRTTGQVMTSFIRNVEPNLKNSLKKQSLTFNSDQTLPASFASTGYEVPVNKIDLMGKLKTDPNSSVGSLLYQSGSGGFDKQAYNAIINPNTDVNYGNMTINYNSLNDKMTFKPINGSQSIGTFVNGYIDNLKIIDEKEFTTHVMDSIYGTVSSNSNKTVSKLTEEEKINKLLNKLMYSDEDAVITDAELQEILENSKNKLNGVVPVDVGCSIIDSVLYLNDISNLISINTGTSDPTKVGDSYNSVMQNSFGRVNTQTNPNNKNAIRDGFFKRLIKTITNSIVFALTATPQIRVLLLMVNGFKNNDVAFPSNIVDDINSHKNFINCLAKTATGLLNEFIFNLLKIELIKIITPVLIIILKEKIESYTRIIESLFI